MTHAEMIADAAGDQSVLYIVLLAGDEAGIGTASELTGLIDGRVLSGPLTFERAA